MDRKKRTELEENELEGITETELARLRRQYRIMDNDRKAYYKETQTVLRKQRSADNEFTCTCDRRETVSVTSNYVV